MRRPSSATRSFSGCVQRAASALLSAALLLAALLTVAPPAAAQGRTDYFNTETVQVHPLAVVEVEGRQYLAAANTPDNSVEIYSTRETVEPDQRFLLRVRTGLEPASLLWVPELGRLYVADALSDAVTVIRLVPDDGEAGIAAIVERTDWVGDEPVALAYLPFEEDDGAGGTLLRHSLVIALRDQDGWGWRDALTLQPISPGAIYLDAAVQKGDIDDDTQPDLIAIKSPRVVAIRCGRLFILGEKGGNTTDYDFDLYSIPVTGGAPSDLALPASSNLNLAFAAGDDLFVVGGEALNTTLRGETAVAGAATGFVKSTLTMVRGACGPDPAFKVRDVNLEPAPVQQLPTQPAPLRTGGSGRLLASHGAAAVIGQPLMRPVAKAKALAQPTAVAVFEPEGATRKVFFTAFGSDRLGIVEPRWSKAANAWPLRRLAIPPAATSGNPKAGPRALALKPANPGDPDDPGHRLYVLNRLDNSLTVVDPVAEQRLATFELRHDPTPQYIRHGRRFLYDAKLGNGFNSCSSCHIDGRTDGLAWDLSDGQSPPIDPLLKDNQSVGINNFPASKNHMVTQSLQGLLNSEVEPEIIDLVTNGPYHWRADRDDFAAFNPAFQNLLGGSELTTGEMDAFVEFIDSVHYPPNPRQPLTREFSGIPFDGDFPNPLPTDAQAGLFVFHVLGFVGNISCAHCHALPEGSENKIPLVLQFTSPFDPTDPQGGQPVEASALRGLFQKEARLARSSAVVPEDSSITGLEGLSHTGFLIKLPSQTTKDVNRVGNLNAFLRHFFAGALCVPGDDYCQNLQFLVQFLHEYDWGVGPLVGVPYTVDAGNVGSGLTATAFDLFEGQADLANNGLAVQAWVAGGRRGFRWNPAGGLYDEELAGPSLTRGQLLALVAGSRDRLVVLGTPLGSERRVASPTGRVPTPPPGGIPPSSVALVPMAPATAWENVPTLTVGWSDPADPTLGGFHSHTTRLLQQGLLTTSPAGENAFGAADRWEAPRRFRVSGDGIEVGARLALYVHDDPANPGSPDLGKTPEDPGQIQLREILLPIHPTADVDPGSGLPVWETAAELDARQYLHLMLGGPHQPAVAAAFADSTFQLSEQPLDPSLTFDAANLDWVYVRVINPNGLPGDGGWQRLRIE